MIEPLETPRAWATRMGIPEDANEIKVRAAFKLFRDLDKAAPYASARIADSLIAITDTLVPREVNSDVSVLLSSLSDLVLQDGDESVSVAAIMTLLGFNPIPWQLELSRFLSENSEGKGTIVCATTPRQVGKTTTLLSIAITRMIRNPGYRAVFTAQTGKDARARFVDYWNKIRGSIIGNLFSVRLSMGSETLEYLPNGSTLSPFVPSVTASHGSTIDMAIIDEAFSLDMETGTGILGAVDPAQLTSAHAQTVIVSTRGGLDDGDFFPSMMETHPTYELSYTGDVTDKNEIVKWHPGVPTLISDGSILARLDSLPENEFRRAVLNIPGIPPDTGWAVISADSFSRVHYEGSPCDTTYLCVDYQADGGDILAVPIGTVSGKPAIGVVSRVSEETIISASRAGVRILADDTGPNRALDERLSRDGVYLLMSKFSDLATWFTELLSSIRRGIILLPSSDETYWKTLTVRPAYGGWVPDSKSGVSARVACMTAILYHEYMRPKNSEDIVYG